LFVPSSLFVAMLATQLDFSSSKKEVGLPTNKQSLEFIYVYLAFLAAGCLMWQSFEGLGLSTCITISAAFQLLAYSMLALKVYQQQSVRGISGNALKCYAVVYTSRLTSTTWLLGYLPSDATGDGFYQFLDVMSLLTVLSLLFFVFKKHRSTYQEHEDTFQIGPMLVVCFFAAMILHPDLNDRPFWDTMWTFALYVDVFAMMPQIWMVSKLGKDGAESLEAMNAHYIGAISASRLVYFIFWLHAFREFAPEDGRFNLSGWAIMSASVIQCLLLADFALMYIKACCIGCVRGAMTGQSVQPQVVIPAVYDI